MRTHLARALALLLLSTSAAAHESLQAVWVQPLAPTVIQKPIVPLGYTRGIGASTDVQVELTPYYGKDEASGCFNGCREQVYGLIAAGGLSFSTPFAQGDELELDGFFGPKLIAAFATETGRLGTALEQPVVIGTSYELGAGLDIGLQVHGRGRFGWFAALVLGVQFTSAFNYGFAGGSESIPNLPTWPLYMLHEPTSWTRGGNGDFIAMLNLNLLRAGFTF